MSAQKFQSAQQVAGVEAKFTGIAATLLPLAGPRGGELYAYAYLGSEVEGGSSSHNSLQLLIFLSHQEDAFAHLLCQQGELDKGAVLVAVADDKAVAVHVGGQHGMQFGLGAGLQTEIISFAVADDFLYHGAHLVDLDGEDDEALALEFILAGRLLKAAGSLLYAAVQNVGKAQQHGGLGAMGHKVVNEFLQVYLHVVFAGGDINVALLVYAKEVYSPASDVVKFLGVFNPPAGLFSGKSQEYPR